MELWTMPKVRRGVSPRRQRPRSQQLGRNQRCRLTELIGGRLLRLGDDSDLDKAFNLRTSATNRSHGPRP